MLPPDAEEPPPLKALSTLRRQQESRLLNPGVTLSHTEAWALGISAGAPFKGSNEIGAFFVTVTYLH
jgi:hypothetical protein